MTEPDEALLWAREQLANTWRKDGAPPKAVAAALAGEFDDVLGLAAHDYRAGAAASAERIKKLEARVAELERQVNTLRRVVGTDKIVPLLKESDQ